MPPRPRPRDWLARRLRAAADVIERHSGDVGYADELRAGRDDAPPAGWTEPAGSPRRPGQPPEHWLRTVAAHAPGLLHDLGLDPPDDAPARPASAGGHDPYSGRPEPDGTDTDRPPGGAGAGWARSDGTDGAWPPADPGRRDGRAGMTRGAAGGRPGPARGAAGGGPGVARRATEWHPGTTPRGSTPRDGEAPSDGTRPARLRLRPAIPYVGWAPGDPPAAGSEAPGAHAPRSAGPDVAGDRVSVALDTAGHDPAWTAGATPDGHATRVRPAGGSTDRNERHTGTTAGPAAGLGVPVDGQPPWARGGPSGVPLGRAGTPPTGAPDGASANTGPHGTSAAGGPHGTSATDPTGDDVIAGRPAPWHRPGGSAGAGHRADHGFPAPGSGTDHRHPDGTRRPSGPPSPDTGPDRSAPTASPWPDRLTPAGAHPSLGGWPRPSGWASPDPARSAARVGRPDRPTDADVAATPTSTVDPWPALPDEPTHRVDAVVVSPGWDRTTARRWAADPWPALPDDRAARLPAGAPADPAHVERLAAEQRGG
ncbi:hypothetical protein ACFY3U_18630 [Micromonospora sp. NPDC000089]|uniref:hypothetical protein n=1 Tax=unclassified Micromonospora TaxID=2617518 RepID=UPI0036806D95